MAKAPTKEHKPTCPVWAVFDVRQLQFDTPGAGGRAAGHWRHAASHRASRGQLRLDAERMAGNDAGGPLLLRPVRGSRKDDRTRAFDARGNDG
jgi:hypothetical protein